MGWSKHHAESNAIGIKLYALTTRQYDVDLHSLTTPPCRKQITGDGQSFVPCRKFPVLDV